MLDYYFAAPRGGAGSGAAPVAALLRECAAALGDACAASEARCVQLGDCLFLLRPSLLRARAAAPPPRFLRLDAQRVRAAAKRCSLFGACAHAWRHGRARAGRTRATLRRPWLHAVRGAPPARCPHGGAPLTPPPADTFMSALLALCDAGGGDASALAAACGVVSPTLHGVLLGYPCVFLFAAENGCACVALHTPARSR
jgi:hypothetical protein